MIAIFHFTQISRKGRKVLKKRKFKNKVKNFFNKILLSKVPTSNNIIPNSTCQKEKKNYIIFFLLPNNKNLFIIFRLIADNCVWKISIQILFYLFLYLFLSFVLISFKKEIKFFLSEESLKKIIKSTKELLMNKISYKTRLEMLYKIAQIKQFLLDKYIIRYIFKVVKSIFDFFSLSFEKLRKSKVKVLYVVFLAYFLFIVKNKETFRRPSVEIKTVKFLQREKNDVSTLAPNSIKKEWSSKKRRLEFLPASVKNRNEKRFQTKKESIENAIKPLAIRKSSFQKKEESSLESEERSLESEERSLESEESSLESEERSLESEENSLESEEISLESEESSLESEENSLESEERSLESEENSLESRTENEKDKRKKETSKSTEKFQNQKSLKKVFRP